MIFNGLQKAQLLIYNALKAIGERPISLSELGDRTGYTKRHVHNVVQELLECEVIEKKSAPRGRPHTYRVKADTPIFVVEDKKPA